MARDKTAREREANDSAIDRRTLLGAAGAGVASAVGVGALATGSATAQEYETIEVPSGQTESFDLGSGDTLENVLIDVTADGAGASIRAQGEGWAIRNVGVKGPNNTGAKKLLIPGVSEGGSAIVENFYIGDGTSIMDGSRQGGVWVNATQHRGELIFRNVNVSGWADNGLYGSGPALQLGADAGSVKIESSYAEDNNIAGFRLGGDDSYVRDSTVVSDDPVSAASFGTNSRGIWAKDRGDVLIENCDIVMSGPDATHAVNASHGASATVRNCRVSGPLSGDVTRENVSNDPSKQAPDGVPMTAEEAAAGTASAGGGSGGSSGGSGDDGSGGDGGEDSADDGNSTTDDGDAEGTVLELVAAEDASSVTYEFTVEGSVTKRTNADDVSAEPSDEVSDNGDGTVTVSGVAGNGYGDSFVVAGDVVSVDLDEGQWTLRYGGEEVTVDELTGSGSQLPNTLVIDGSDHPRAVSTYAFTVTGEVEKSGQLGSINDYDEAADGQITGRVVGGADGYRFSGEITGFTLDGPASVHVEDGA